MITYRKMLTNSLMLVMSFIASSLVLFAQIEYASPSNWLFPDGNPEATHNQKIVSQPQPLNYFAIKWSTSAIAGDVQPLIGNIINNPKLYSIYNYAPNEICAVIGDKIVLVDATGKKVEQELPKTTSGIKSISVLFDSTDMYLNSRPGSLMIMGLETMEVENLKDSLAYSYLAGYDPVLRQFKILNRLAIDLRPFNPNIFASIKPVFAKKTNNEVSIYSVVNMSNPNISGSFFRGIVQFNTGNLIQAFPFPDVGDINISRVFLGPECHLGQPSLSTYNWSLNMLLPVFPTINIIDTVQSTVLGTSTETDKPYLVGLNLTDTIVYPGIGALSLNGIIPAASSRPFIKPYYINIYDQNNFSDSIFILIAEQYNGIDSSRGQARIHLLNTQGNFLTLPQELNPVDNPSFNGTDNHYWSISVGNVDGLITNSWFPYYPNNFGNELVVTQSSRDFAVAQNRLSILRYSSGARQLKPSPPNSYLYQFDTLCSQRINGWVAAVNDLDGAADRKDEIVLVDGSTLRVMRMRDYADLQFRAGNPFDTVFTYTFTGQTISNVAIADLEGDGLNDLIVTTFDSTYVFGTILANAIDVVAPLTTNTYCAGDMVEIRWANIVKDRNGVDIMYKPLPGYFPNDTTITIRKSYPNTGDTVSYFYIVDSLTLGTQGYFIVMNEFQKHVKDSTSVQIFNKPHLDSVQFNKWIFEPGETLTANGVALCVDSVAIEYKYRTDSVWTRMDIIIAGNNQNFSIDAVIPCVNFFRCDSADADSLLDIQLLGIKGIYSDTSLSTTIRINPVRFPVVIDTCTSVCKVRYFSWNPANFQYTCDSMGIYVSYNCTGTFELLTNVALSDGQYEWELPLSLPNCVTVRFCCINSCIRLDTNLQNNQVQYINIVAPNPFNPTRETADIVYKVPSETNVTVRIIDQNNRLVSELANSKPCLPNISYCEKWSGIIWNGAYAENGMYYVVLEMSNGIKEVHPIFVRK
ncbi:MAG: VCBS repeat-containing protein [Bacteroidetes bacterium]|nr:MAG: VCBS repeat-containing protein [Bacteroidota bacterium]